VTMTDKNSDRQREMIDYFSELGLQHIWTDPLFPNIGKSPYNTDKNRKNEYQFDMEKYVNNYIDAYRYAKGKGVFWGSFLAVNFDGEESRFCRACTPLTSPHLTTDGDLSACDFALEGKNPHHMKDFIYGKWQPETHSFEIYDDRVKALQERKIENMKHCKDCDIAKNCGGYCAGEILNETGKLDGQKLRTCKAIKKLHKEFKDEYDYKHFHP